MRRVVVYTFKILLGAAVAYLVLNFVCSSEPVPYCSWERPWPDLPASFPPAPFLDYSFEELDVQAHLQDWLIEAQGCISALPTTDNFIDILYSDYDGDLDEMTADIINRDYNKGLGFEAELRPRRPPEPGEFKDWIRARLDEIVEWQNAP